MVPAVVLVVTAGVAWRFSQSLQAISDGASSFWIGIGVFVLAGLLLIPFELLAIAAGVAFGALRGGVVALIGSLTAAVLGYLAGRAIGAQGLTRWISQRSYRSVRQLGPRGVAGMACDSHTRVSCIALNRTAAVPRAA